MPSLTFLLLRFTGVLVFLLPLVVLFRAPWPHGRIRHVAVAGVLLQAGYLAGVWCAIKIGMPAGLSALIVGLQPILTAFAAPLLGESVKGRQWVGLALGLCGVGLVVANKISLIGLSTASIALCVLPCCASPPVPCTRSAIAPTSTCAQVRPSSSWLPSSWCCPLPWHSKGWTGTSATCTGPRSSSARCWSVLALSIGAIFLLFALIRRSAATSVTSLLYLTPPTTAVMAWLMFGEAFSLIGALGMLVGVIGVAFVVRK
jgi:drug/metabolite transporter (DMT)-like permease